MENLMVQINKIFNKVFEKPNLRIKVTDSPFDIEGWDSLTHVLLITAIEDHFLIEFSFRELASIKTVGDLANMIENKTTTARPDET
jgi:acyl carrier protein